MYNTKTRDILQDILAEKPDDEHCLLAILYVPQCCYMYTVTYHIRAGGAAPAAEAMAGAIFASQIN